MSHHHHHRQLPTKAHRDSMRIHRGPMDEQSTPVGRSQGDVRRADRSGRQMLLSEDAETAAATKQSAALALSSLFAAGSPPKGATASKKSLPHPHFGQESSPASSSSSSRIANLCHAATTVVRQQSDVSACSSMSSSHGNNHHQRPTPQSSPGYAVREREDVSYQTPTSITPGEVVAPSHDGAEEDEEDDDDDDDDCVIIDHKELPSVTPSKKTTSPSGTTHSSDETPTLGNKSNMDKRSQKITKSSPAMNNENNMNAANQHPPYCIAIRGSSVHRHRMPNEAMAKASDRTELRAHPRSLHENYPPDASLHVPVTPNYRRYNNGPYHHPHHDENIFRRGRMTHDDGYRGRIVEYMEGGHHHSPISSRGRTLRTSPATNYGWRPSTGPHYSRPPADHHHHFYHGHEQPPSAHHHDHDYGHSPPSHPSVRYDYYGDSHRYPPSHPSIPTPMKAFRSSHHVDVATPAKHVRSSSDPRERIEGHHDNSPPGVIMVGPPPPSPMQAPPHHRNSTPSKYLHYHGKSYPSPAVRQRCRRVVLLEHDEREVVFSSANPEEGHAVLEGSEGQYGAPSSQVNGSVGGNPNIARTPTTRAVSGNRGGEAANPKKRASSTFVPDAVGSNSTVGSQAEDQRSGHPNVSEGVQDEEEEVESPSPMDRCSKKTNAGDVRGPPERKPMVLVASPIISARPGCRRGTRQEPTHTPAAVHPDTNGGGTAFRPVSADDGGRSGGEVGASSVHRGVTVRRASYDSASGTRQSAFEATSSYHRHSFSTQQPARCVVEWQETSPDSRHRPPGPSSNSIPPHTPGGVYSSRATAGPTGSRDAYRVAHSPGDDVPVESSNNSGGLSSPPPSKRPRTASYAPPPNMAGHAMVGPSYAAPHFATPHGATHSIPADRSGAPYHFLPLSANLAHPAPAVMVPPAMMTATAYSRKDKSLGLLCENFMARYGSEGPQSGPGISIDAAAAALGVERRRIYDIINILESVHIVSRKCKNTYRWHGMQHLAIVFAKLQQIAFMMWYDDAIENGVVDKNSKPPVQVSSSSSSSSSKKGRHHKGGLVVAAPPPPDFSDLTIPMDPNAESSSSVRPYSEELCRRVDALSGIKEKSLGKLSQRFIQLFLVGHNVISLNDASDRVLGEEMATAAAAASNSSSNDPVEDDEDDEEENDAEESDSKDGPKENNKDGKKRKACSGDSGFDAKRSKTKIRRLYDIANVLVSIGVIVKTGSSSTISGGSSSSSSSSSQKNKPSFRWVYKVKPKEFAKVLEEHEQKKKGKLRPVDKSGSGDANDKAVNVDPADVHKNKDKVRSFPSERQQQQPQQQEPPQTTEQRQDEDATPCQRENAHVPCFTTPIKSTVDTTSAKQQQHPPQQQQQQSSQVTPDAIHVQKPKITISPEARSLSRSVISPEAPPSAAASAATVQV